MLALLYHRALRAAATLRLDELERLRTRQEIALHSVLVVTGLASALKAALLPTAVGVWAGFVSTTLPITMTVVASRSSRRAERLRP